MKDGFEHQHQHKQALVKLKNVEIVKIITQLVFSVSLFFIFFARLSWHDFHQLSNAIDKNYIFLLCNGILIFLAKYSGLIRSLSTSNGNDEIFGACENISMADSLTVKEIPMMVREDFVRRTGSAPDVPTETIYPSLEKDEKGRRTKSKVLEMAIDDDEENVGSNEEEEDDADDDVGEEGSEGVSFEELNRKFDEFIRRMKKEIRTEAQDQPKSEVIKPFQEHL